MSKVILNQIIYNQLPYPLHTLKKILKSEGFDLNRSYTRTEDTQFNRITFTQDEQLQCGT